MMIIKSKCLLYWFSISSKTKCVFPHFVWPMKIAVCDSLIYSIILFYLMSIDSPYSNLGNTKMFLLTTTKMSKFMTIQPSHFGCAKSSILTWLKQMYIENSCLNLGIGIKISDVSIGPSVIDPNEGCCITRCTFLLTHIIPGIGDKLKKPAKKSFHVFSFDDTEEKVTVRLEGEKGQDAIYEITLCKYLDPENELPIDPSIRFLCVTHPA